MNGEQVILIGVFGIKKADPGIPRWQSSTGECKRNRDAAVSPPIQHHVVKLKLSNHAALTHIRIRCSNHHFSDSLDGKVSSPIC